MLMHSRRYLCFSICYMIHRDRFTTSKDISDEDRQSMYLEVIRCVFLVLI